MSAPAAVASFCFSPLGDDRDLLGFAEAVRQAHGAAHLLVGLLGVHAQADVQLDGLVELGGGALLDHRHGVVQRVQLGAVEVLDQRLRISCPLLPP